MPKRPPPLRIYQLWQESHDQPLCCPQCKDPLTLYVYRDGAMVLDCDSCGWMAKPVEIKRVRNRGRHLC